MTINIHQVKGQTSACRLLFLSNEHHALVGFHQFAFRRCFLANIEVSVVDTVHAPIVEDSATTIATTEAFLVHTTLAEFLTSVEHIRIGVEQTTYYVGGIGSPRLASEKVARNTLLVMIFQEIEHVVADIISLQPLRCDVRGPTTATDDVTQAVIHAHLVI